MDFPRLRRFVHGVLVCLTTLGALFVISGCSSSASASNDVAPKWEAWIRAVLSDNPSELEYRVLSDFDVTDVEFREAQNALAMCLQEKGVAIDFHPEGGSTTKSIETGRTELSFDAMFGAYNTCVVGTTEHIEVLFYGLRDNPQGVGAAEARRDCFMRYGVKDGSDLLSLSAFEEYISQPEFIPTSDEGKMCMIDPHGLLGLSARDAALQWDSSVMTYGEEE
ncbi:MAG: hypothetical protein LBH13_06195 [Cellulomonadaceae bacterium]|jgi:hypothetical protein|nr:hypothetical protein [Cellulomonadaceae bacterium]